MAKAFVGCCTSLAKSLSSPSGTSSKWVTGIDRGEQQSSEITSGKGLARGSRNGRWDEERSYQKE